MKIFCAVNNYVPHNKAAIDALFTTEEPVFFMKPDSALLAGGRPFFLPDHLGRISVAAHLVVRICRLGKTIPERFAHRYWDAMTVGLDFTAESLLQAEREAGLPWTMSKALDGSAVVGQWVDKSQLQPHSCFRLDINGETCQQASMADMLRQADALVAKLSETFTLKHGDLIYTGSPSEAMTVNIGDTLDGWLNGNKITECRCK